MTAMGVSGRQFPSSIEALLRRAFKGGEPPRINPLVDFYNAVSLRHVVPAGGFDLEDIDGALELRLTRQKDTFQPLDGSSEVGVEPGEVAYASGNEILTRYFVWKQSRKGLLDESTRLLFLVSEVLGKSSPTAVWRTPYWKTSQTVSDATSTRSRRSSLLGRKIRRSLCSWR